MQLDRETKDLLERIKREIGAKNYAQAIRFLAQTSKRIEKGHMGSLPKLERFRREKHDRFDR